MAKPNAPAARRRLGGVQERSYGTKPAQHTIPPKVAPVSAAAAPAAAAKPGEPIQPNAPTADVQSTNTAPDKPVDSSSAAAPADASKDGATKPPELTEAEESKRLARINRADAKLNEGRQALAAERATFAQERQQHAAALSELAEVRKMLPSIRQNPIAFLQRFGVAPQDLLNAIIADGAKPAATKVQEHASAEASELRAKIADLEKSVQTASEAQRQQAYAREVEAHKTSAIAPVLADKAKYELTHRFLGDKAVDEVFALQEQRFRVTQAEVVSGRRQQPEVLTPAQAADIIESHLRSQRDLLSGTSVAPAKPTQPTTRTEPAAVQTSGSQTTKPATPGVRRPPVKPYQVRSIR